MKLSARNQLKGKVVSAKLGTTTAHVKINVCGAVVTAAITDDSAKELTLAKGKTAVIQASDPRWRPIDRL